MSDPRPSKQEQELEQVKSFLSAAQISFERLERGQDPPDVLVTLGDSSLGIEVTEYHPEGHAERQARWEKLRDILDARVQEFNDLRGIRFELHFHDLNIPANRYHESIVRELIKCTIFGLSSWFQSTPKLRVSFSPRVPQGFQWISSDWLVLEDFIEP